MNITVLGAGAWGTALAISLSAHHRVTLWTRNAEQLAAMKSQRSNARYLPGHLLPENLLLEPNLSRALDAAELVILAVPVAGLRETLQQLATRKKPLAVIWLCKGFEADTGKLPHQVAAEILPENFMRGVLSGPSFAQEVARGLPTALTFACNDESFARSTAQALHHQRLRVYASTDVTGVEVGGAVKNALAIAAGICDGMGLGFNARAALITRGLAEIARLGVKLGGRAETLGGLSGAGDLILTCTGDLSRNRQVGMLLAKGQTLPEILQHLGHVAEGVYTVREVRQLAQKLGVAMPICEAVYRIIYDHIPASAVIAELLSRTPNSEFGSLPTS
ncbi:MAG: NAD(P)H-dependent glycerol-3-phosphate dehydrogenase [Gallionella sp.]